MSFFDTLKSDWKKFEGVVVKDEQIVKAELEKVFGAQNVDSAIALAEAAAKTKLGALAQDAVGYVENELATLSGPLKSSIAGKIISQIASATGVPFSMAAINHLIEIFAPFVANAALTAVTAGL